MILLLALAGGLPVGLAGSRWRRQPYQPPELRAIWLAFLSFLPQFALLYIPRFRDSAADQTFAICLQASMLMLGAFTWLNHKVPGMKILFVGLALNLTVIVWNGGFMPIAPHTAAELVGEQRMALLEPGDRFSAKDRIVLLEETHLEWLSDRFLTPAGLPYRAAFSFGDVFIAIGAFIILARPGLTKNHE